MNTQGSLGARVGARAGGRGARQDGPTRSEGLRAAVIAALTSLVIVRACLYYVAEVANAVTRELNRASVDGYAQEEPRTQAEVAAAEAAESALATLGVIAPLSFILPFAGWSVARRARVAVPVARCASLIAVAVWALSICFIRFGMRPLLSAQ